MFETDCTSHIERHGTCNPPPACLAVLQAGLVLIKCAHVLTLATSVGVGELSQSVLGDLQSPGQRWPFGRRGRMTGYFSPKINAHCRVDSPKTPRRDLDLLEGD